MMCFLRCHNLNFKSSYNNNFTILADFYRVFLLFFYIVTELTGQLTELQEKVQ